MGPITKIMTGITLTFLWVAILMNPVGGVFNIIFTLIIGTGLVISFAHKMPFD